MTEKYPTWLEVWYYGAVLTVKGETQSYIVDGNEAPGLVAARGPESGEEFVIFDGGQHGYDNLFCDKHDPSELEHRPLKRDGIDYIALYYVNETGKQVQILDAELA